MQWHWFVLLTTAQMLVLITSESVNTNSSSLSDPTRTVASVCNINEPACSCARGFPQPRPELSPFPCILDAVTCECARDTANTGVYVGVGPSVPPGKTCVFDAYNCKCMTGSLPLAPPSPGTPPPTFQSIVANVKAHVDAIQAELDLLFPEEVAPAGGLVALSAKQRERLIEEVVRVMGLLRDVARRALTTKFPPGGERDAMVARLREEIVYLGKIRDDSSFMTSQLGRVVAGKDQPIIKRLRKILTELEYAAQKASEGR